MIVAALALALYGLRGPLSTTMNALLGIGAPVIGGLFIAVTLILLVADLKRPDRALFLITKANPTSWLVWGGYILGIFGLIEAAWFGASIFGLTGVVLGLLIPAVLFGAAATGYSAFLFGQAEGRDFWQSPLFLPILLVQALLAGSAALGLLSWALNGGSTMSTFLTTILLIGIVLHVLLIFVEVFGAHANNHVASAARYMTEGPLRDTFWGPFFIVGSLIPIVMLCIALFVPAISPGCAARHGRYFCAGRPFCIRTLLRRGRTICSFELGRR